MGNFWDNDETIFENTAIDNKTTKVKKEFWEGDETVVETSTNNEQQVNQQPDIKPKEPIVKGVYQQGITKNEFYSPIQKPKEPAFKLSPKELEVKKTAEMIMPEQKALLEWQERKKKRIADKQKIANIAEPSTLKIYDDNILEADNKIAELSEKISKTNKHKPIDYRIVNLKTNLNYAWEVMAEIQDAQKQMEFELEKITQAKKDPKRDKVKLAEVEKKIKTEWAKNDNQLDEINSKYNNAKRLLKAVQFEKKTQDEAFKDLTAAEINAGEIIKVLYPAKRGIKNAVKNALDSLYAIGSKTRQRGFYEPTQEEQNIITERLYGTQEEESRLRTAYAMPVKSSWVLKPFQQASRTVENLLQESAYALGSLGLDAEQQKYQRKEIDRIQQQYAENPIETRNIVEKAFVGLGDLTGSLLFAPVAALAWTSQGAGSILKELDDRGVNRKVSQPIALIGGGVYYLAENLQKILLTKGFEDKLLGNTIKNKVLRLLTNTAVGGTLEAGTEAIQKIVTDASEVFAVELDKMRGNKGITPKEIDILKNASREFLETLPSMLLSAGLAAGAGMALDKTQKKEVIKNKALATAINRDKSQKLLELAESVGTEEGLQDVKNAIKNLVGIVVETSSNQQTSGQQTAKPTEQAKPTEIAIIEPISQEEYDKQQQEQQAQAKPTEIAIIEPISQEEYDKQQQEQQAQAKPTEIAIIEPISQEEYDKQQQEQQAQATATQEKNVVEPTAQTTPIAEVPAEEQQIDEQIAPTPAEVDLNVDETINPFTEIDDTVNKIIELEEQQNNVDNEETKQEIEQELDALKQKQNTLQEAIDEAQIISDNITDDNSLKEVLEGLANNVVIAQTEEQADKDLRIYNAVKKLASDKKAIEQQKIEQAKPKFTEEELAQSEYELLQNEIKNIEKEKAKTMLDKGKKFATREDQLSAMTDLGRQLAQKKKALDDIIAKYPNIMPQKATEATQKSNVSEKTTETTTVTKEAEKTLPQGAKTFEEREADKTSELGEIKRSTTPPIKGKAEDKERMAIDEEQETDTRTDRQKDLDKRAEKQAKALEKVNEALNEYLSGTKLLKDYIKFEIDLKGQISLVGNNGIKIAVDFVDKMDKGEKGKWNATNRRIKLSKEFQSNTITHELLHAARDLGLITDKEWKQLYKIAKVKLGNVRVAKLIMAYDKYLESIGKNKLSDSDKEHEIIAKFLEEVDKGNIETKVPFIKRILDFIKDLFGISTVATTKDFKFVNELIEGKAFTKQPSEQKAEGEDRFQIDIDGEKVEVQRVLNGVEIVDGFYSNIEKKILDTKKESRKAEEWLNDFGKTNDETIYTGMLDFLESKGLKNQVKKSEVLDFIKNNRIEIVDVVKKEIEPKINWEYDKNLDEWTASEDSGNFNSYYKISFNTRRGNWELEFPDSKTPIASSTKTSPTGIDELKEEAYYWAKKYTTQKPKFSEYQLDNEGENYREVLITIPVKEIDVDEDKWVLKDKFGKIWARSNKENKENFNANDLNKLYGIPIDADAKWVKGEGKRKDWIKSTFHSSHFDEGNILAHLRINEREDKNGNKVLFIEEIQSDWGQAFRDKKGEIASTPFITNTNAWVKLALKYAMQEAVRVNADYIAWTTGEQQVDRYNDSKRQNVDKIRWEKNKDNNTVYIAASKNEQVRFIQYDIPIDNKNKLATNDKKTSLDDIVGKNIAQQIRDSKEDNGEFKGAGLSIGGQGMYAFYGMPKTNNKGIIGGVVESKDLFGKESITTVDVGFGEQHAVAITDEIKNKVEEGLSRYQLTEENMERLQIDNIYHGSPFLFNRFLTDKMGTGEGAQAFGWGLYFTDKKEIADWYAKNLGRDGRFSEEILDIFDKYRPQEFNDLGNMKVKIKDKEFSLYELLEEEFTETLTPEQVYNEFQNIKRIYGKRPTTYKTTLHKGKSPDEYDYIDWDEPITDKQIDKINIQLEKEGFRKFDIKDDYLLNKRNLGSDIYERLQNKLKQNKDYPAGVGAKLASLFLLRAGIDGIKYPAGSLSGIEDSDAYNYVVFDENAITIEEVERYALDDTKKIERALLQQTQGRKYTIRDIDALYKSYLLSPDEYKYIKGLIADMNNETERRREVYKKNKTPQNLINIYMVYAEINKIIADKITSMTIDKLQQIEKAFNLKDKTTFEKREGERYPQKVYAEMSSATGLQSALSAMDHILQNETVPTTWSKIEQEALVMLGMDKNGVILDKPKFNATVKRLMEEITDHIETVAAKIAINKFYALKAETKSQQKIDKYEEQILRLKFNYKEIGRDSSLNLNVRREAFDRASKKVIEHLADFVDKAKQFIEESDVATSMKQFNKKNLSQESVDNTLSETEDLLDTIAEVNNMIPEATQNIIQKTVGSVYEFIVDGINFTQSIFANRQFIIDKYGEYKLAIKEAWNNLKEFFKKLSKNKTGAFNFGGVMDVHAKQVAKAREQKVVKEKKEKVEKVEKKNSKLRGIQKQLSKEKKQEIRKVINDYLFNAEVVDKNTLEDIIVEKTGVSDTVAQVYVDNVQQLLEKQTKMRQTYMKKVFGGKKNKQSKTIAEKITEEYNSGVLNSKDYESEFYKKYNLKPFSEEQKKQLRIILDKINNPADYVGKEKDDNDNDKTAIQIENDALKELNELFSKMSSSKDFVLPDLAKILDKKSDTIYRLAVRGYRLTKPIEAERNKIIYDALYHMPTNKEKSLNQAIARVKKAIQNKRSEEEIKALKDEVEKIKQAFIADTQKLKEYLNTVFQFNINNLSDEFLQNEANVIKLIREIQAFHSARYDKLYQYWINSVLLGFAQNAVNIIGNTFNGVQVVVLERLVESMINMLPVIGGSKDNATFGELKYLLPRHLLRSFAVGAKYFAMSLKAKMPMFLREGLEMKDKYTDLSGNTLSQFGFWSHIIGVRDIKGVPYGVGAATVYLSSADDFFVASIANLEVFMQAYRLVENDPVNKGLTKEEKDKKINELVADTSSEAWILAKEVAKKATFKDELQGLGKKAQELVLEGKILRFYFSFLRIGMNIGKYIFKTYPPTGILLMAKKGLTHWSQNKEYKTEEQSYAKKNVIEDLAKITVGIGTWLLMGFLQNQFNGDDEPPFLTGGNTIKWKDFYGKEQILSKYSIRLGGTYFNFSKIEPIGSALGMMVDASESKDFKDWILPFQSWKIIQDKYFIKTLANIATAVESQEDFANVLRNPFAGLMPSIVRGGIRAADPLQRQRGRLAESQAEKEETLDFIGRQLKLLRYEWLPFAEWSYGVRVNHWGDDIQKNYNMGQTSTLLYRLLSPVQASKINLDRSTKVDWMIIRYNENNPDKAWYPSTPKKEFSVNGNKFSLTDKQFTEMLKLRGRIAKEIVYGKVFNYNKPSDGDIIELQNIFKYATQVSQNMIVDKEKLKPIPKKQ